LSNVWGAAVMPTRAVDFDAWPIGIDEMAPHYAAVGRMMPVAAAPDDLAGPFPFYAPPAAPLRMSRLAVWLLARMQTNAARLRAKGLQFGQSRLAVRSDPDTGCRYTGLCLTGCPYFAIWNAGTVLDGLREHPGFAYQPGVLVDRLEPAAAGVRIHARDHHGSPRSFLATRVLLACGPIATLRIVADSLRLREELHLQYQPYFLLPLLCGVGGPHPEEERLHTLAQIFLELDDRAVSPHLVHLQLYTYNRFIRDRVAAATAWLGPLRELAARPLVGRLAAIQGYLDSRDAPPIAVGVSPREDGRSAIRLTAPPSGVVRATIGRSVRRLTACAASTGAVPLGPLCEVGSPGDGNHVGGIFPMRRTPGRLETDTLGQLAALPRVHIVDSASMPSLPATTVTYTIMAHAHRIASALARDETAKR
jgi:choline dehydrogenase-like flavoprotein